jgi:hypothetical protein
MLCVATNALQIDLTNENDVFDYQLRGFWSSTGFSPPDSNPDKTKEFLLSDGKFIPQFCDTLRYVKHLFTTKAVARAAKITDTNIIQSPGVYCRNSRFTKGDSGACLLDLLPFKISHI